jgi:cytochrome c oxidase subunit IV
MIHLNMYCAIKLLQLMPCSNCLYFVVWGNSLMQGFNLSFKSSSITKYWKFSTFIFWSTILILTILIKVFTVHHHKQPGRLPIHNKIIPNLLPLLALPNVDMPQGRAQIHMESKWKVRHNILLYNWRHLVIMGDRCLAQQCYDTFCCYYY